MAKTNKIILYIIAFVFISNSGCKDYLETNPSTQVSDQVLLKRVDGAQTVLNGIYRYIRNRNSDIESNGIISYQPGFDASAQDLIVYESMGQMQLFYGHHLAQTRADGGLTSGVWSYFYTIINNANIILQNIDQAEGAQDRKNQIKGQVLAIRGWAYFYLVRFYQQTYAVGKDLPAVPYYSEAGTEGKAREKVSVVYGHIVNDLKNAIELLGGFSRGYKSQINRSVAQGILAEVYLTMEDWSNAAALAKEAAAGYPLMTPEIFQSGFNDWRNGEWMWGVEQTEDQNFGNASPFTLWANQTRGDRWTFDFYFVNDKFKELFSEGDARYQFWQRSDRSNLWTSDKFRDDAAYRGDVVLMRAAEMYLIEAEALARLGQDQQAKNVLWQLQDARTAERSQSSGAQLVEDILIERRKELYGEGFAWFDLIRNQKPLHREGDHPRKPEIPARSWKFILQIPTAEFTSNKSLAPNDQNPYDGIFK
ncbi:RagB/SusD family nutrient uptake outer membrane protein [Pontibacter sp. SGAir0037]|uniref:RagB/SusD family nutrient uptake outer membrane protein n=1 Tax=Pontibacter sp. SGAir0037 TaxID=2571030 RepID=UPI0010CCF415|nr:RagB/SusD family nutrient uptake outer membrane protein [Pontibacter sp. SGAir0037]QCR22285.1 RagB/SusD family nutrient uptake outer membrane protein [Pontibacter sp. SGAir0037]